MLDFAKVKASRFVKDYSKSETSKVFDNHGSDKGLYLKYRKSSQNSTRRKQIKQLSKWMKDGQGY